MAIIKIGSDEGPPLMTVGYSGHIPGTATHLDIVETPAATFIHLRFPRGYSVYRFIENDEAVGGAEPATVKQSRDVHRFILPDCSCLERPADPIPEKGKRGH